MTGDFAVLRKVTQQACRSRHECRDCGRPICPNESCLKVVYLEYTGRRKNRLWSEFSCCARGSR